MHVRTKFIICGQNFSKLDKWTNDKCSKILNTNYLPIRPRQTVHTQIRLLPGKQSDLGLPCLLF